MSSNSQFTCKICNQGFEQKSRLHRHMLTSHPEPAPSIADVEKLLASIKFPKSKSEILNFINSQHIPNLKNELLNLVSSLPNRKYRDSAEIAQAIKKIKNGKKVKSSKEAESLLSPGKKGGKSAAKYSISAATLARSLSGINLPQSKENINRYLKENIFKMNKDIQSDILKIYNRLPKKKYKDMTEIEKELSKSV
ncbi:MAG: C2H2-type zinc finger protein [Nitrososphaeraceae archaeon]|nr:C2H2-type zinc finger protein [Nitrososphaeraceae archaeon]